MIAILMIAILLVLLLLAAWTLLRVDVAARAPMAPVAFQGQFQGQSDKSAMVIVEPRKHKHLRYVVQNFDKNMPKHYALYIFHGASAGEYARQAAQGITGRAVHYVKLDTDNMTAAEYNAFLKTAGFWDRVDAENVLVFQTDAALCSASRKKISDFEHLGYVGCSFGKDAGRNTYWGPHAYYGVGGLSFRKKSVATECLKNTETTPDYPEDVFYSECVEKYGEKPRDGMEISQFCSQGEFLADSFGAHKPKLMKKHHLPQFLKYCPEAAPLVEDAEDARWCTGLLFIPPVLCVVFCVVALLALRLARNSSAPRI